MEHAPHAELAGTGWDEVFIQSIHLKCQGFVWFLYKRILTRCFTRLRQRICWSLGPLHICPTEGADVLCPLLLQNCLRRRDAGLLNQLQELDKQISDLRLDVEKTTDEHLETDSRPSSGKGSAQQNQPPLGPGMKLAVDFSAGVFSTAAVNVYISFTL